MVERSEPAVVDSQTPPSRLKTAPSFVHEFRDRHHLFPWLCALIQGIHALMLGILGRARQHRVLTPVATEASEQGAQTDAQANVGATQDRARARALAILMP